MTTPRRRAISTPGERRDASPRGPVSVAVSVVLHVVFVFLLIQLTVMRRDWFGVLTESRTPTPIERVGFLQLPRGPAPNEAPRRGGNDRAPSKAPAIAPLRPVAPMAPPKGLPAVPTNPPRTAPEIGTGPLVGGGGDTRGVRPSFAEPRLWVPAAPEVTAPLAGTAKLDSAIAPIFKVLADSMRAAMANGRDPNDWTFKVGGQKFGIDRKFIRLGPVSIPTAALAFLPLNVQGNPTAVERDRRLSQMRSEILDQAARAARDEDFQKAVKALRERKQKEHDEKTGKKDPPPTVITP